MAYLIDTDIIIFNLKGNPAVQEQFRAKESIPKVISVITYGELLYGAKLSNQTEKNLALIHRLPEIFPIVGVTRGVIESFVEIKRSLEERGNRLEDMDLLIAATAMTLNYRLVTNNVKHYRRIRGLEIENWMEQNIQ